MTFQIEYGDLQIEYSVVESSDATQPRVDINIHEVKVVVPEGGEVDPQKFVEKNAGKIAKKWQKYEEYRNRVPERRFEEGETFPFLGEEQTIRIREVTEPQLADGELVLPKDDVEGSSIREELRSFLKDEARELLSNMVEEYAAELNVDYDGLALRNQRTRWGSCSPKKNLSFNWRLVMAPPEMAEYVVVHELTHLKEQNHTNRFWRLVREQLPDYRSRANWLEEHSVDLIFTKDDL